MVFVCAVSGCRNAAPAPTGTGARAVVTKYFEALAQQDWETAYAQLHPDTKKRMDRAAFERHAHAYCKQLGFTLGKVFIRSCDERDEIAIAQLTLTDADGSAKHRFREGAVLQHMANGWGIVLPENSELKR